MRLRVPAAIMIQKTYRGLLGRRRANWQRVIRRLKKEDDQTLSWLRQKYVADAVQDAELAALVSAFHSNKRNCSMPVVWTCFMLHD